MTTAIAPSAVSYELVVVARNPQVNTTPDLAIVDPVSWTTLRWSEELNAAQQLTATCRASSLLDSVIARLSDLSFASELWLYRGDRIVFAGPLTGVRVDGEAVTLDARGLLSYLSRMVIAEDTSFTDIDQHTIVQTLVDDWQDQDYGNYGIDTTDISESGTTRTIEYPRKELHIVLTRIEELAKQSNGFNFEVEPATRKLQLWTPTKGVDRSTGEDAIVFDDRNITNASVAISAGPNDIASEAYGSGTSSSADQDETLFSSVSNTELRAKFGRSGVRGTFDAKDQTSLDAFTQDLLDSRSGDLVVPGPDARNSPDADLNDYSVGDTVYYRPTTVLNVAGAYRIRKREVTVNPAGVESVSLEFV